MERIMQKLSIRKAEPNDLKMKNIETNKVILRYSTLIWIKEFINKNEMFHGPIEITPETDDQDLEKLAVLMKNELIYVAEKICMHPKLPTSIEEFLTHKTIENVE